MRGIEFIVIIIMSLSFYTIVAKIGAFDSLPTLEIRDLSALRTKTTDLYTIVAGYFPFSPHDQPVLSVACESGSREPSIILRLDDVQAFAWREISMRIIEDILERNLSITLGVIPEDIQTDADFKQYLKDKTKDNRVEIAQHGTNHSEQEFLNLNDEEAYNVAQNGRQMLIESFEVYPVTFIPPENVYNENTTRVLSRIGFTVFSAGQDEFENDGYMQKIGYSVSTSSHSDDAKSVSLIQTDEIIQECHEALGENKVCVIMIHPQDYSKDDGSIDEIKYTKFTRLLDGLLAENLSFTTFRAHYVRDQRNYSDSLSTDYLEPIITWMSFSPNSPFLSNILMDEDSELSLVRQDPLNFVKARP